MLGIKTEVIIALQDLLGGCLDTEGTEDCQHLTDQEVRHLIKAILSIPELAIVDREAELPEVPWQTGFGTMKRNVYRKAQQDMLKAGWVKEVIDNVI